MNLYVIDCVSWVDGRCIDGPHGRRPSPNICRKVCTKLRRRDPAAELVTWLGSEQPAQWAELHTYTRNYKGDRAGALAFLADYRLRIVSLGCDCQKHWDAWVEANPPDLRDAETFFIWSWRAHDAVSERIGKPRVTFAQAFDLWPSNEQDQAELQQAGGRG